MARKTRADIEAILGEVKFLDRKIRLLDKGDGFLLQVTYHEPDIATGKTEEQHARKWYVSPFATETEIVETAFAACQRSMMHVVGEWFTYKGRRVYSPHFGIDARIAACDASAFDGRRPLGGACPACGGAIVVSKHCGECGMQIDGPEVDRVTAALMHLTCAHRGWGRAWAVIKQRHGDSGAADENGERWQYMGTHNGEHEFRHRGVTWPARANGTAPQEMSMSDGMNRWTGLGNLTESAELRFTQGGQAVLNFRIACNESYVDKDKVRQERVEYVPCCVWGKRAEGLAKILDKGKQVLVEGRLETQKYEGADGVTKYRTQIVVLELWLTGNRGNGDSTDRAPDARPRDARSTGGGRPAAPRGQAPARPAAQAPTADDYDSGGGYGGSGDDDIPF